MTSSAVAAISTTAARLAIGAILMYEVLLVVLIFLRPDLDPSWHTISEWAIGPQVLRSIATGQLHGIRLVRLFAHHGDPSRKYLKQRTGTIHCFVGAGSQDP